MLAAVAKTTPTTRPGKTKKSQQHAGPGNHCTRPSASGRDWGRACPPGSTVGDLTARASGRRRRTWQHTHARPPAEYVLSAPLKRTMRAHNKRHQHTRGRGTPTGDAHRRRTNDGQGPALSTVTPAPLLSAGGTAAATECSGNAAAVVARGPRADNVAARVPKLRVSAATRACTPQPQR